MTEMNEVPLDGGWQTDVRRVGDVVLRSPKPQSRTVVGLLTHLVQVGFDASPRPLDGGFASDGREQLGFIEGESPQPRPWSNDAVWEIGRMVNALHLAAASFEVPTNAHWRPWFARSLAGTHPVIGHGDLGPWNILARAGMPVAMIDWDNAGPVDALWELAQVVWLNAQLHDDDVAAGSGLPDAAVRARQAALILDGYGLARDERVGFVDRLVEMAIRCAREEAIECRVGHDSPSPTANGYPVLWAVSWRARSAAWMLDHRALIQNAIDA